MTNAELVDSKGRALVANSPVDSLGSEIVSGTVIDVTPTLDTSAYANNDVLFNPVAIPLAVPRAQGWAKLDSLFVLDEDHQAQSIDFVFSRVANNLGTINAAVSITDALARDIVGLVSVITTDYKDLVGSHIAEIGNIGKWMNAAAATQSLFVSGILRSGTPTYTAAGLKLKLGFTWN
jgi:hypothetical protein